jgi:uncharacterized protein (DUF58 family)
VSDVGRDLPTLDLASAEPLLRRLELTVRNKLDGLLQGNYLGLVPGPGSEAGESRLYYPGDDVRRMDWPVTARTLVPHVRQTIADRELESWLVVDLSPSIDFGTAFTTPHGGLRAEAKGGDLEARAAETASARS